MLWIYYFQKDILFDLSNIMEFLQANPAWITSSMFLLTFGESIVILGLFIPASLVMPGIGALAAAVGIGPVEIMFYASLGMIIGDTVSYAIGLIIGTRIETWVPNQYQKQLHQAKQFMNKYGILSVALGRFLGPLRSVSYTHLTLPTILRV